MPANSDIGNTNPRQAEPVPPATPTAGANGDIPSPDAATKGADAARASTFGFMRERIEKDAGRVRPGDIDELAATLPKKLKEIDLSETKEAFAWIGEMLDRVKLLWRMLRDANYVLEWKTKAMIAAGLIYFVLPMDLTPDFIPGIGYIDDAVVLGTLWKLLQEELDRYSAFAGGAARAHDSLQRI